MRTPHLVCILVAGLVAGATTHMTTRVTTATEPEPAAPSLNDLAFLAGAWTGEMLGGVGEEYWTTPRAGAMLGAFRLIHGDETSVIEHFVIHESDAGVTLRFQHYTPDFTPWEDAPLAFRLVAVGSGRARFVSPDPSQSPDTLEYSLADDTLTVRVSGVKDENQPGSFTVRFQRMIE
ncbi:MAG: hypothetical protein D6693_08940 [Planctomycetota bacterium]|nr:MAG: hypothetical protein D6693_08940 [Planctomycetota bacterium]